MITKVVPHTNMSEICNQEPPYLQYRESIKVLESELAKKYAKLAKLSAEHSVKLAKINQENRELRKRIEELEKERENDENN